MTSYQADFAHAVRNGHTVWTAGVYDALSAKLAQEAGFKAVMTSGFAVSASLLGLPDVELYTMTENLGVVRNVANAVTVPVVADTDTGYGNAINVMRTVREFEQAGASAVIFEDQEVPKRCPCVATTLSILPLEEGAAKIKAAVHARRDPNLVIVARTDAVDVQDAITRAQAYVAAGADIIQPISRCFTNLADLKRLREACGVPLSLQLLGWLEKDLTPADIQAIAGLAVYPLVGLMTVTNSLRQNFQALHQQHSTQHLPLPVTDMNDFKKFIGFAEVEALQNQFLVGK